MVRDFLEELISDTAESAFERATLPRGIEEKLARVDWKKRDVLIVNVPDEAQEALCLDERSCAVRGDEISEEHLPIHYVALVAAAAAADRGERVRRGECRIYEPVSAGEQYRVSGAAPAVGGGVPVLRGAEETREGR